MLLSRRTTIKLNSDESNVLGHMCYAAYKLWNICNYERKNYKELGLTVYPDWYRQKAVHKNDVWFKSLPSQTAQEVCKLLDGAWKSYFKLLNTNGVVNPRPPRFKNDLMPITYMQNGIKHNSGSDTLRLSISKQMKQFMKENYSVHLNFLFLKNACFQEMDSIKQIKLYPPVKGVSEAIIIYEVSDANVSPDNGRYLSIDMGLNNLLTCYDSANEKSFIVGRMYLSLCRKYDKQIQRIQSQWYKQQLEKGVIRPKSSKHICMLHLKKANALKDYLHKITHYITEYCVINDIHTVVMGDITGIRKNNNMGHVVNQKLHGLPFTKIRFMIKYKLALKSISFVLQKESYSSQCSPSTASVSKANATPDKRRSRGSFIDNDILWNADAVGAYNILRLYAEKTKKIIPMKPLGLSSPTIIKVAV